jgi:exodeoxyribonuclease-3
LFAGIESTEERFPEAALRMAGYGAIWHGQKAWNGVVHPRKGR